MATFTITAQLDADDRNLVYFTTTQPGSLAWSFDTAMGGSALIRGPSAAYRYTKDGTYTVTATANNGDTGTVKVTLSPNSPHIDSIAPATGLAAGGTAVVIRGAGFTGATGVTFGGVAGTAFSVTNDNQIAVTTAAHATGVVDVVVASPNGALTAVGGFTYT
jgi:PKD repeat protein